MTGPGSSPSTGHDLGQFLNDLADAAVAVIETESIDEVDLGLKAIRAIIDENVALAFVACVRRLIEVDPRASEIDVLYEAVRS